MKRTCQIIGAVIVGVVCVALLPLIILVIIVYTIYAVIKAIGLAIQTAIKAKPDSL
jgi:hypothetical protein